MYHLDVFIKNRIRLPLYSPVAVKQNTYFVNLLKIFDRDCCLAYQTVDKILPKIYHFFVLGAKYDFFLYVLFLQFLEKNLICR